MTIGDVAKEAGVVPATVRYWCNKGLLPCERTVAGVRLVSRRISRRFIASRNARKAQPAA
jgi:DNA-binding transcriptional MerR regulator